MFDELRSQLRRTGLISFMARVRTNAPRTKIKEVLEDGTFKIDLKAAAEKGKANTELMRFIAEEFGVASNTVSILSGQTVRKKMIRIDTKHVSPSPADGQKKWIMQ